MKDKLFTIVLCLLLVLSVVAVAIQGVERSDEENVSKESDLRDSKQDEEYIENSIHERDNSSEIKRKTIPDSYRHNHEDITIDGRWKSQPKEVYPREKSVRTGPSEEGISIPLEATVSENYLEVQDPIRIDSNEDFADKAEGNNWSGDGSENDPYIIEGYEIDVSGHGFSIYIGNVTDHFEVNKCRIYNTSEGNGKYFANSGLHLFNTSNGKIQDNVISRNSGRGIYLSYTENNIISNNTIYSNEGHEIQIEESENIEVLNNNIQGEKSSSDLSGFQNDVEYSQDSVLVQLESPDDDMIKRWGKERALKLDTDEIANMVGGITSRTYPAFNMAQISLKEDMDVKMAVELLAGREEVLHAEPNYIIESTAIPNDPGYDSLWAMPTINAPSAWDITTGSEEVVVAVIDSGIDYNHPDLKDNMWTSEEGHHGFNAINNSYYPMDENGHGTHVAGTIGAIGDNDIGVVGVNWNVSLMAVKFLGERGIGTIGDAIAGLEYVLERKIDGENIVATSNSWGVGLYSELLYEAIEQHQEEDILFVGAAGNNRADNDRTPFYPASYDLNNIISVSATDEDDDLARFSNYGERSVHVGAPGVDINSTLPDGEYGYLSGTSMAAPHVSGLIALLRSHHPNYDHNQLKNAILSSSDHLDSLQNITLIEGRINAYQALEISPDPEDIRFWIHRPTSEPHWGEETPISISLNDGVNPVEGANVSVDFSRREESIYLEDDGSGGDQPGDGYYTNVWIPRTLGEVELYITAELNDGRKIMENITVTVSGDSGIVLFNSDNNLLNGNQIINNSYGVSLYTSESNIMSDNFVENNDQAGIKIYESKNNELKDQIISDSEYGLLLERADENFVFNNTISDTFMGIRLKNSEDNTFNNNNVSDNAYGIIVERSNENTFTDNEISSNFIYGLILYQSKSNRVDENIFEDHLLYGIYILQSEDNLLTENTASNNRYSIFLSDSNRNKLEDNYASDNLISIYIGNSEEVTLSENTMIDGGIYMIGLSIEHWNTHSIDTSNTVNGDPVLYWKNESGGTVSQDAGQIILANCEEVIVKNQEISGGSVGILLGFSSHITLKENNVTNSDWEGITLFKSDDNKLVNNNVSENEFPGIFLFESKRNTIVNNTAANNQYGIITFGSSNNNFIENTVISNRELGITLSESDENVLENNFASENGFIGIFLSRSDYNELDGNTMDENELGFALGSSNNNIFMDNTLLNNPLIGIYLEYSSQNTFEGNEVELNGIGIGLGESDKNSFTKNLISNNNEEGIYIIDSSENLLYRNKIIQNEEQAWDNGNNSWDRGDPAEDGEGGNYWSDYDGKDRGDGIGDEPYLIDGYENQDSYPWMTEEMVLEEKKERNIFERILDRILDRIDLPRRPDRPDMPQIPGFSFLLLISGLVVAVAIHHTKKR